MNDIHANSNSIQTIPRRASSSKEKKTLLHFHLFVFHLIFLLLPSFFPGTGGKTKQNTRQHIWIQIRYVIGLIACFILRFSLGFQCCFITLLAIVQPSWRGTSHPRACTWAQWLESVRPWANNLVSANVYLKKLSRNLTRFQSVYANINSSSPFPCLSLDRWWAANFLTGYEWKSILLLQP